MSDFYKLRVNHIIRETPVSVSFAFDIPEDLKKTFLFIQGQYITLKLFINNEELRRCYSVCTSPNDGELRVAVKKVKGGKVSNWLNEHLKVGDQLDVLPPMGNFYTDLNANNSKNYILFAGGSGITPIISITKSVLEEELKSKVVLLYGSFTETEIIFKDKLDEIEEVYADRLKCHYILDVPKNETDELHKGIMTIDKTKTLIDKFVDITADNEYFICGPPGMKENVLEALANLSVEKSRIHIEVFTSNPDLVPDASPESDTSVEEDVQPISSCDITFILDGDEYTTTMKGNGNILQVALDEGIDAPFSCRGGMCSTCRAKVTSGKANMKNNSALTDSEVEEGYILTCQGYPITESIIVDYDEAL